MKAFGLCKFSTLWNYLRETELARLQKPLETSFNDFEFWITSGNLTKKSKKSTKLLMKESLEIDFRRQAISLLPSLNLRQISSHRLLFAINEISNFYCSCGFAVARTCSNEWSKESENEAFLKSYCGGEFVNKKGNLHKKCLLCLPFFNCDNKYARRGIETNEEGKYS